MSFDANTTGPLFGASWIRDSSNSRISFGRAAGAMLYDEAERSYCDFVLGVGPVITSHTDRELLDGVFRDLSNGVLFPGYQKIHSDYAATLESSQPGMAVGSFFKTSSEAVAGAIRCAELETGKTGIIRCGFVGWHDDLIGGTPKWHEFPNCRLRYIARLGNIPTHRLAVNALVPEYDLLRDLFEKHSDTACAFVVDSFQFALFGFSQFEELRALADRFDIRIILDETKTSGRCGPGGAYGALKADYLVLGKAIANGFPLSVLLGNRAVLGKLQSVGMKTGGTYSKEVVSVCAAAHLARLMSQRDGYNTLAAVGAKIANGIAGAIAAAGVGQYIEVVPHLGGRMFSFKFGDQVANDAEARDGLDRLFTAQRILAFTDHPNFICLAHADISLDDVLSRFSGAFLAWKDELSSG